MVFKLDNPAQNERKLTCSVIQVIELLGMYHAELARILKLQCSDIGELTSGKRLIKQDSEAGQRAALFIETYQQLYDYFDGSGVAMYHWMRAHNKKLNGTPHFLIVDEDQLSVIHDYLYRANNKQQGTK